MSTETIILIGVVIYLLMMLAVGMWAARRSEDTEDFIVAGRRMPMWMCAATVMATWFGSSTILGAAGESYQGGFLGVIADPFGGALALLLVGFLFVRIFRRLKLLTVIEFFELRFGKIAGLIAAAAMIISNIGWTGGLLVGFGLVFETLTGIPIEIGIWGGAIIVLIYTTAGGMWAVATTDFLQMTIITVGLIILAAVVWFDVGGWAAIGPQLPDGTFRMIPVEFTAAAWLDYFRLWFIYGLADCSAQTLMQRASATRTEQDAQNAFYLAGIGYLSIGLIVVMLGITASVILPGINNPEAIIPTLAQNHLHPILIAFFVGALLSAIMSSADSALLAAASVYSTNLLPYFKPEATSKQKLFHTRLAIPVLGVFALVVALKVQVVYDLIIDANSMLLACVVAPFILGIWWKKSNRTAAYLGMGVGFVVWMVTWMTSDLPGDLLGFGACLLTLLVVSPLTQRSDPALPLIDGDGNEVEPTNRLGTLPLFRKVEDAG